MKEFDYYSVKDLKEIIKYYNKNTVIKGYSKMNKDELIKNMNKHIDKSEHFNNKDIFYFKGRESTSIKDDKINKITDKVKVIKDKIKEEKQKNKISEIENELNSIINKYKNKDLDKKEKEKLKNEFNNLNEKYNYNKGKFYKLTISGNESKRK
jgi:hypothetical protein